MNLSLQISRGLAALALGVTVSAYAMTHAPVPATSAIPTLAAISVTATPMGRTHVLRRSERCETSVVVGAPIDLGARTAAR
ncbi:MAG TPA: hypothetical protein VIE67_01830 [Rudaea sp.]|jgi:hypothetical protein|uniref:hypothetical protein n=1 Tax=Rudaea sp. TaxID=2136325 RepID=UPI002F93F8E6